MKKLYFKKSKISGNGIYAQEPIKKGEFISFIKGEKIKQTAKSKTEARSMELYYGLSKHVWLNPEKTIWRYFNHSCNPNTAIIGRKKLIALKNILIDEELTFDYSMTDGDILWEMPCNCGSKNCRHVIKSIQRIDEKTYNNHLPFIPIYFQQLRKRYLKSAKIKK